MIPPPLGLDGINKFSRDGLSMTHAERNIPHHNAP